MKRISKGRELRTVDQKHIPSILLQPMLTRPALLIVPIGLAVLAAALVIGSLLYWSALQVDIGAAANQKKILSAALERNLSRIAKDQEASTVWDDAIARTHPPDPDWLDANLGIWMHGYYGHDQTYIVDDKNQPIYAMVEGRRSPAHSFSAIQTAVLPLLKKLRMKIAIGVVLVSDDVLTLGAADIAVVSGHPAIISAKPIVSDTGNIPQAPGSEYVHISVRYLDGDFISRLQTDYSLDSARFSWDKQYLETETSLPYRTNDGETVGYLIWSPYRPGSVLRGLLQPALIVALCGIAIIVGMLAFLLRRGATALRTSEARARHLAEHDPLTDLPNRILFDNCLDVLFHQSIATRTDLALLTLDLDRFKQVNDSLGHPAGDELLRQVAARFCRTVRGSDLVARLGGDEFCIILPTSVNSLVHDICSRLLAAIDEPFEILGNDVSIGVSIGVAVAPADASNKEDLIRRSDLALYSAKQTGRGRYVRFSRSLESDAERVGQNKLEPSLAAEGLRTA